MTEHAYMPPMDFHHQYTAYELEKEKKYLLVNNMRSVNLQPNGLPEFSEIVYVNSLEDRKQLFAKKMIFAIDGKDIYPATLDQIKALYDPKNEAKVKTMKFLCDNCTEIKNCPRFDEPQRYCILYDRETIFNYYSYYRGLAYHATILECPSYKPGKINRNRGFKLVVKRCADCPWHKEEEVYDDNSEDMCTRCGTYIRNRGDHYGSDINYIPDWCPELPENKVKKEVGYGTF